jgi:hypothetical protein
MSGIYHIRVYAVQKIKKAANFLKLTAFLISLPDGDLLHIIQ